MDIKDVIYVKVFGDIYKIDKNFLDLDIKSLNCLMKVDKKDNEEKQVHKEISTFSVLVENNVVGIG